MGNTPATETGISESIALLVPFQFNSAQIMPDAAPQLDALAEGIKMAGPGLKLIIEGHTDAHGSDQYNLILSFLRASAVKNYLVKVHQIAPENITVVGMGKRMPLNAAEPNAPENRRVEFRIKET
ncbi:MAG: OmpA family protein [Betaproteobacteria bacterium]|nr:OmpA family protein [Betaproteobacteria bacterium]